MTTWYCLLCAHQDPPPPFEFAHAAALLDHVAAAHALDRAACQASSGRLVEAMDGPDWYRNTAHYYLPEADTPWAMKLSAGSRDPDDPMRG
ncbi:MAG TPA: hypothetical protein VNM37_03245 [Candidatus Dormibacteraeota bacterium]|nr:hypothetical protein [Candidatus Dormibacteraeota bacterium]